MVVVALNAYMYVCYHSRDNMKLSSVRYMYAQPYTNVFKLLNLIDLQGFSKGWFKSRCCLKFQSLQKLDPACDNTSPNIYAYR